MKKQIKGFEDYYVDTEGRVWTNKSGEMKERKPKKTKKGYLQIGLWKNNKQKTAKVHRLVAMTFLDNPENYEQVNHKNGIKTDNRLENLEWCSPSQNIEHALTEHLFSKGSKHYKSVFTEQDVLDIIKRLEKGERQIDIAREYKVSRSAIWGIKYKINWKHLNPKNERFALA